MSSKRPTLTLALATTVGLLAGCGGSGASSSQPMPAGSLRAKPVAVDASDPATNKVGSSHSQFVAFAAAVNLRPQDVAGFVGKPKGARRGSQLTNGLSLKDKAQYQRCLDVGKEAKPIFKRSSANFERGAGLPYLSASSEVQVTRTNAMAEKALTTARRIFESPKKRMCLTGAFNAMIGGGHTIHTHGHTLRISIGNARVAPVQIGSAAVGTGGGFGMSFSMDVTYTFTIRGRLFRVPGLFSIDSLNVIIGRASVGLTTIAFGGAFPAEQEASLFALLVARGLEASRNAPAITQ